MKVLIVGSDKVYAIENFYVKYLRELGVETYQFSAQTLFYDYYQDSLRHKLLYRSGISRIIKSINVSFMQAIETYSPDVIWVFKGMEILPDSLRRAKQKKIKLVNYNPDSPFVFSGPGSGNRNVTGSIALYDLFLTYNDEDKKRMEQKFKIPSRILPFGFDLNEDVFDTSITEVEKCKLCFLGNPDNTRASFLTSLADEGLVIDLFGNDWSQFVKHDNISIHEPVYENQFWTTLRRYRIQLNLMRPHNPTSHNMRTFEACGVGAIQLAPATIDHTLHFESEKEIFLYKDARSCFSQAKKLLSLCPDKAMSIRQDARSRSLHSGYTYKDRAAQALSFINQHCG